MQGQTGEDDTSRSGGTVPNWIASIGSSRQPVRNQLWVADFTYVSRPGGASSMLPLSSTSMPDTLSAGASAGACTRTLSWMPWSKPCTPASRIGTR